MARRPNLDAQQGARRRRVVEGVRSATMAILTEGGLDALSISAVAARAGVARTTIYRRWPTRAAMVMAMIQPRLERLIDPVDSGNVEDDVVAVLARVGEAMEGPEGQALAAALTPLSEELGELASVVVRTLSARVEQALVLAVQRGELPRHTDVEALAHLLFFGAVMWRQSGGRLLTDDVARRLARAALPKGVEPPEAG